MQADRRFSHTGDEQQHEKQAASAIPNRASVWIDQLEQHQISASYAAGEPGEERRKRVIHPITPIPSTPIPLRASAQAARSSAIRPRALRSYLPPAPQQDARPLAERPTLPPAGVRYVQNAYTPRTPSPEVEVLPSTLLHPESTVSRAKNASLSPHQAIDELDTVPQRFHVSHILDVIDEIDTHILPMSPSIDELDTLSPIQHHTSQALQRAVLPPQVLIAQSNEVSIDEIDTIPPDSVTIIVPPPPRAARYTTTVAGARIVDSRPPVSMGQSGYASPLSQPRGEGSWTVGDGASEALKRRIASKVRDKQGKSFGELVFAPLDGLRWWLLYPGRMEFMMWVFGALLLLGVTCTLLFATLASAGIIKFNGVLNVGAVNTMNHSNSQKCTTVSVDCRTTVHPATTHTASTSVTVTNKPGVSGTATSGSPMSGGASTSTPTNQTPVGKASATPGVSPTVQPTQTTPTPFPTATAKPSPTIGVTPTSGSISPTPKPTTTGVKHTDTQSLSLSSAFDGGNAASNDAMHLWFWLALLGYVLSMALLGLAGVLYRRKRRA